MSLVVLENITHQNGGKILYRESSMRINKGEHVALLGPNGCGKTTLLNIISKKVVPNVGEIEWHPKAKIGYLDQHHDVDMSSTAEEYLKNAYADLYEKEERMHKLYEQMAIEYKEEDLVKALEIQEELNHKGFDTIEKTIGNLVSGLGIEQANMTKKLSELSGGQRGKILLAKLLLKKDDFILLDEPTNFLDVEQVKWLVGFLQNYENAFLLVSHDRDFINKIVNIIYAIENQQIVRYVGNYDKYLELSSQRAEQYDKERDAQQQHISKLKEYVAKNIARASTSKSAKSRQKQLEKIDVMDKRKEVAKPTMSFKYKRPSASVVVTAKELEIGYNQPLTKPLTFELREGEKCIVKGYNGIGKTTFLKTIANETPKLGGSFAVGDGVEISFFHQISDFDDNETPVSYLMSRFPDVTDAQARATVAKFGLRGEQMVNKMISLSGGEQTKVRLAALSLTPSSMLILDEPTNHIDVIAKDSLLKAIKAFEGTVLITTHDINFETQWADKVLDFETMIG